LTAIFSGGAGVRDTPKLTVPSLFAPTSDIAGLLAVPVLDLSNDKQVVIQSNDGWSADDARAKAIAGIADVGVN
jgi:hypothetical protein